MIKHAKAQVYALKNGSTVHYDAYIDGLTVYLKHMRYDQDFNTNNIKVVLKMFEKWSGLKSNTGKKQVLVFGIESDEPPLV